MAFPAHKKRKLAPSPRHPTKGQLTDDDTSEASSGEESIDLGEKVVDRDQDVFRTGVKSAPFSGSAGAFNSSMLQLQVDELLSTVRPDYERRLIRAENALRKLKGIIERIPPREAKPVRNCL